MPPIFLYWSKCAAKLNPGNEWLEEYIEPVLASRLHPHGRVIVEPTYIWFAHPIVDSGASSRIPVILIIHILCVLSWLDCRREFVRLVKLLFEELRLLAFLKLLLSPGSLRVDEPVVLQMVLVLIVVGEDERLVRLLIHDKSRHPI